MSKNKSLKILDQIKIESPCNESWDKMIGNKSARHCASCVHTVRNLSALTKQQAAKVLNSRGNQRLCIRYEMKSNGEIKFKEGYSWKYLQNLGAVALATFCTFLGLTTFAMAEDKRVIEPTEATPDQVKMGEMPMEAPSPSPTPTKELMGDYVPPNASNKVEQNSNERILMGKVAASK